MKRLKGLWCLLNGHLRSRRHVVDRGKMRYSRCKRCGADMVQTRDRKWLTLAAYDKVQGISGI
ncbi:hypothetical protein [Flavisphingomonas formosensis]|uniref:hypothetical protein n=1 Tax=Flavisphingomonas formosensis TaxID=861534 RepID=UPI0012FA04B5|nr:hypothetical protein [Sphingomonas formosensis]